MIEKKPLDTKRQADIMLDKLNAIKVPEEINDTENQKNKSSSAAKGFSAASHLISGILVGMALGYGMQTLFDIKPWGMAVMIPIGFIAGMMNMIRTLEK